MLHNRANSLKRICRIDVTAFASVMVVLVFTMLLIVVMENPYDHGVKPELPKVWHPVSMWTARREGALVIVIMRDDTLFFGNDRVTTDQLPMKIRQRLDQGAERKLYIRADARIPYRTMSAVLDAARSAGVEKIAFLVEQRRLPSYH